MARIDLRVRAWAWLTRRQASVATMTEEQVRAAQARPMPDSAVTNWICGVRPAGTMVSERVIPGPDGNEVPVRIYRPLNPAPGPRPLVVYFHGGGFVFGALRMGDWICGSVAAGVGAVVVSVDYRLAPGHRFPAAVEDGYAALTWAAKNAADLGAADVGAGGPLGVMGESAGGNLSAVVTLLARDRGGPAISHQALLYPVTDMTEDGSRTPSARANTDMPFLSAADTAAFRNLYFGPDAGRGSEGGPGPGGVLADPKASPLRAEDHAGLPPALIQVAEHDPLRDDGTAYAAALRAAGVPVRLTEYVGQPHGFLNFPGLCRGAEQALSELIAEQRSSLA
ncbi:MAG TPA: alpha/beta hydrolase [Trebonia sp.]|jgi:acetyl esterase